MYVLSLTEYFLNPHILFIFDCTEKNRGAKGCINILSVSLLGAEITFSHVPRLYDRGLKTTSETER